MSTRKENPEIKAQTVWDHGKAGRDWRRGSRPISDLVPKLIDPICARKGLASSALLAAWPDLVGAAFRDCTVPEKIDWPYQRDNGVPAYRAGTLIIRVDGPKSIYLQHEAPQILQRVNKFFGFVAIERLKIIQAPIIRKTYKPVKEAIALTTRQEARLRDCVDRFDNPRLDAAILSMGRAVLKRELAKRKT